MTTTKKRSNLEILANEPSQLGLLCLRRRELLGQPGVFVTEVTLEQELLMSSYVTDSERALARRAVELMTRDDLRVLVGGLGLGYTAQEALGSERVGRVDVVEYLPEVIRWLRRGLIPLSAELNAAARLRVIEDDIFSRLSLPPDETYDVIVIDIDHSPEEQLGQTSASFYSEIGLRLAKQHLRAGGVLGVWSYSEDNAFLSALRSAFTEVRVEAITVFNDLIDEEQTDWLFFARG